MKKMFLLIVTELYLYVPLSLNDTVYFVSRL